MKIIAIHKNSQIRSKESKHPGGVNPYATYLFGIKRLYSAHHKAVLLMSQNIKPVRIQEPNYKRQAYWKFNEQLSLKIHKNCSSVNWSLKSRFTALHNKWLLPVLYFRNDFLAKKPDWGRVSVWKYINMTGFL